MAFLPLSCTQVYLTSDASGPWGCGTFWEAEWLQLKWPTQMHTYSIAFMELLPIFLATTVWGPKWQSCKVICRCDNQTVVAVINKGSAKDPSLAHLFRCISFYAAHYHFSLHAQHVPGHHNRIADALSRNNLPLFSSLLPQATPAPEPIPQEAVQMAMMTNTEWTSQTWKALFVATLPDDLPSPPLKSTPQHKTDS